MLAERTGASAAWPATRDGNALATSYRSGPRPPLSDRLAALVGRHSKAMGMAVIVRDEELALSVVAIYDLGN